MLESLTSRFTDALKSLRTQGVISEKDIAKTAAELRTILLDADVSLEAVDDFEKRVKQAALGQEVSKALNPAQQILKIVHNELEVTLGKDVQRKLRFAKFPPTVITLAGLQGSGKTTFAGKLALHLKNAGQTPLLVAADLQRPNAVQQLETLGGQINVPVYAPERGVEGRFFQRKSSPVRVTKDAVKFAREKQYSIVIIDTAGRLGVDTELIKEARDIKNATDPDEVLFVIDAMIGQDAAATARAFNEGVGVTGVVLSKLDGDARGGAALSVVSATNKPILFASTGEKLEDMSEFHPERMASRILDLGDILSLIEQAEKAFDENKAEAFASKIADGNKIDLNDFLEQLLEVKKLGSIKGIMSMLPGMNKYKSALDNFDDREILHMQAMIQSMTPFERENPKELNGSRKLRIAKGSGTSVTKVNKLLDGFKQLQKMMRGGGLPAGMGQMAGIPGMDMGAMGGMPAMGGFGGKNKKGKRKKMKNRSGNPAKRAESTEETLTKLRNR
jgi:signal recognition particle subunit SRP54